MLVERLVWRAKSGQGDTVVAALKDFRDRFGPQLGVDASRLRLLVDTTGSTCTVVFETTYRDMAHFAEENLREAGSYGTPEFRQWFGSWQGAVDGGTHEVYSIVD